MSDLTQTKRTTSDLISNIYDVSQVEMAKTNDFDFLINYISNIKYDVMSYHDGLYNENNPALAEKYSSLFFHANVADYQIQFSTPSTARTMLVVEKDIVSTAIKTIVIPKETSISALDGSEFTLDTDITIIQSNGSCQAYTTKGDLKIDLTVSEVPHPQISGVTIFVINLIDDFKQQKIMNFVEDIPEYNLGEFYKTNLPSTIKLEELVSLDVYRIKVGSTIDQITLDDLTSYELQNNSDLVKMSTSFDRFSTGATEEKLIIEFNKEITLLPGDGINGVKLDKGDRLYIRTVITKGSLGNVVAFEGQIKSIPELSVQPDGTITTRYVDISAYFPDGSVGGKTLDDVRTLRESIVRHIYTNTTPITRADFENYFRMIYGNNVAIRSTASSLTRYLYAYTPLIDDAGIVYKSTSALIKVDDLPVGSFMKEYDYSVRSHDGSNVIHKTIFPAYIDKLDGELFYKMYAVNEVVNIPLRFSDISKIGSDTSKITMEYDYASNSSYIRLYDTNGTDSYTFTTNQFTCTLKPENQYTYRISELDVCDKQFMVKILKDFELMNDSRSIYQSSTVEINQLTELSTLSHITLDEVDYWVNVPLLDIDDYKKHSIGETIKLLTKIMFNPSHENQLVDINPLPMLANTIAFDYKYENDLILTNDNTKPLVPTYTPVIDLIVDKLEFMNTKFENLEHLRNTIGVALSNAPTMQGFDMDHNEYTIENLIKKDFPFVKNARMVFPLKLKTQDERHVAKTMRSGDKLDKIDLVGYTPVYFSPIAPEFTIRYE